MSKPPAVLPPGTPPPAARPARSCCPAARAAARPAAPRCPGGHCPPEQAEQVAPLLKALGDPVRLRLMSLAAARPGSETCACDLAGQFDLSQPTISHHLKVLHQEGLLDGDKRGVWVYYKVRSQAMASLGTLIGYPGPA